MVEMHTWELWTLKDIKVKQVQELFSKELCLKNAYDLTNP